MVERISYLYWVGAETWLLDELDAQVSEDGYYSFKDLNGIHIIYLKKQGFPYVDIISPMCICVYYLKGQEDDAINKLKEELVRKADKLSGMALDYEFVADSLEHKPKKEKLETKYD